MSLRSHHVAILVALAIGALSVTIPAVSRFFVPGWWLAGHVHELCHALMAIVTGGSAGPILVHADGSGLTYWNGGNQILTSSAGYMGEPVVGAATIFFSRTAKSTKVMMRTLGGALALSVIFFVRDDPVGIVTGIGWAFVLCAVSYLPDLTRVFVAQLLGVILCLNAIHGFYWLLDFDPAKGGLSDAAILNQETGIPAIVWTACWAAFGILLMAYTLVLAWKAPVGKESILVASALDANATNPSLRRTSWLRGSRSKRKTKETMAQP